MFALSQSGIKCRSAFWSEFPAVKQMFVSHEAASLSHQAQARWPKDSQVTGTGGVSALALRWRGHLQRCRWVCASPWLSLTLFSSSHPLPFELNQLHYTVKKKICAQNTSIHHLFSQINFPSEIPALLWRSCGTAVAAWALSFSSRFSR